MKKLTCFLLATLLLLTACGQGASSSAENLSWQEQYDLGIRYLSEGNYEEAIISFTAAIEIDPKRSEAYIGLADAYEASGNPDQAVQVLVSAMEVADDSAAIQNRLDALEQTRSPEPEAEPNPEPTAEWEVTPAMLAYAPTIEESQWYYLERNPTNNDHYIVTFNFSQTGECNFMQGYVNSYVNVIASGTYSLDGNMFQFAVSGEYPDYNEVAQGADPNDVFVFSGSYSIEITDPDTLVLTQTSDEGLFYYHEAGHQMAFKKGYYS